MVEKQKQLIREESLLIKEFVETGNDEAFKKLMSMYEPRILRFGARMCGHHEDAQDVVQDTLMSAFRYMGSFRGDGSFQSWLFKIASSACLKKRRKKKHEPKNELSLDQISEDRADKEPVSYLDGLDAPLEQVEAKEMLRRLQAALLELPPIYRIVITLRDFEGMNNEAVAEILDISVSATKVRLHRARKMLKAKLGEI